MEYVGRELDGATHEPRVRLQVEEVTTSRLNGREVGQYMVARHNRTTATELDQPTSANFIVAGLFR
jgi:hypothetical protein